jgi:acetyl-CoA carboxylase carboxyltransferase component
VAPPRDPATDPARLAEIVPLGAKAGYDMYRVIEALADADSIFPWADEWGGSVITCLARIDGNPVGFIASQPIVKAGALDADALTKERDFIDLCDTFNLPIVFLHDVPGLMVGTDAEKSGILKAYEKLALRISTAKVPKIGVVIRKAYGGGHFAMGGRPTHPDFLFAWPSAEMGFMAPDTGVRTVYRRRIDTVRAEQGDAAATALADELRREWETESEPWEAAAHIALDDVIEPGETRAKLIAALDFAWGMQSKRVR